MLTRRLPFGPIAVVLAALMLPLGAAAQTNTGGSARRIGATTATAIASRSTAWTTRAGRSVQPRFRQPALRAQRSAPLGRGPFHVATFNVLRADHAEISTATHAPDLAYRAPGLGATRPDSPEVDGRTQAVVHTDGRITWARPAMLQAISAARRRVLDGARAARASNQRVVYLSIPIASAGNPETNRAIGHFIADRLSARGDHVLNPTEVVLPAGASGDDYMHLWEGVIDSNHVTDVHFVSNEDVRDYFASRGEPVPAEYATLSAASSVGCRYEVQIFAAHNARPGNHVQASWGRHAVDLRTLQSALPTRAYRANATN